MIGSDGNASLNSVSSDRLFEIWQVAQVVCKDTGGTGFENATSLLKGVEYELLMALCHMYIVGTGDGSQARE